MTMQNTYPIHQITPESSDEEKQRAVIQTVEQLVSEGLTQEEAQTQVMQMLQTIMQGSAVPTTGTTRYGDSMRPPSNIMRERTSNSPKSVGYFRNDNSGQVLSNFNPGFLPDGRISNK